MCARVVVYTAETHGRGAPRIAPSPRCRTRSTTARRCSPRAGCDTGCAPPPDCRPGSRRCGSGATLRTPRATADSGGRRRSMTGHRCSRCPRSSCGSRLQAAREGMGAWGHGGRRVMRCRAGQGRAELGWAGLGWTGQDQAEPDRTGLGWTGLDWAGLGWTGLDWTRLDWTIFQTGKH